jgi:hypothetical protein
MQTNDAILIYSFSQFSYTKAIRDEFRLSMPRFNIFLSVYYATKITPQKRGLKSRIMKLNPQKNQVYIEGTLQLLHSKGLIVYIRTEHKHRYTLEVSKEGYRVIDSLYSIQSIGEFIDKY